MCKKIHRGGNAEQYNADKKYKEAVAEAVEACADDTKGHTAAYNYATLLKQLSRFEEARSLLRKTITVAPRVLGENHELTLSMMWIYANTLSMNESATVADLSEAVTTLESAAMSYKRVLGQGHPETPKVQKALQSARAKLALVRASTAS